MKSQLDYNISWISMLSYMKSFYHEMIDDNIKKDEKDIRKYNNYLMNIYSPDVNTKIYKQLMNLSLNYVNLIR